MKLQSTSEEDRHTLDVDCASKIEIGDVDENYSVYSEETSVNIVLKLGFYLRCGRVQ